MQNTNQDINRKIKNYLMTTKFGASSSEISKKIGHSRITVTKYLEILKANGEVSVDDVAQARLWKTKEKNEKPKVLIVDDEPNVVDLVALSLIPGKYEILKAYSGLDALDRVYQESPDLIILDLMMPGVDGFEVCKRIKNSSVTQHIPIIILSAKGEIRDKLKGMDLGADDYITKPFDPMEMEARVNTALRRIKKDIDKHPLSKLPGEFSCKEEIEKRIKDGKKFLIYNYRINNLDEYKKKFGYRKTNDTISLIARAFADSIKDCESDFLCHTFADNFILITNDSGNSKLIKESFNKILPYIYSNGKDKKSLELDEKRISTAKIKNADDILNQIEA